MSSSRRSSGPGIVDVARLAGVSPATVSRSLRDGKHVSPATRRRVLEAAESLRYVVSPVASRLASGRTSTVGVVVPFVTRWFFGGVVAGAEPVLHEAGLDVLLYDIGGPGGRQRFFARMPLRRRVDAVLVMCLPLGEEERAALAALDVPVVTVGTQEPGFAHVRIDDAAGARQAVRHLVNLGHEHIAFLTSPPDEELPFTAPRDRHRGYHEALLEAGLDRQPDLELAAPYGIDGGAEAMEQLLSNGGLPTAAFAESDDIAFGALRTLRRSGLPVPEELSLVGFDDHDFASVVDLTTIRQPVRRQGEVAAALLLDALAHGGTGDQVVDDVVLPTRLVVRGSSAPPRRRSLRPAPRISSGAAVGR